jgi:hypothetical protein
MTVVDPCCPMRNRCDTDPVRTEGSVPVSPRTPLGAPAVRNQRPDRPAGHGKAD